MTSERCFTPSSLSLSLSLCLCLCLSLPLPKSEQYVACCITGCITGAFCLFKTRYARRAVCHTRGAVPRSSQVNETHSTWKQQRETAVEHTPAGLKLRVLRGGSSPGLKSELWGYPYEGLDSNTLLFFRTSSMKYPCLYLQLTAFPGWSESIRAHRGWRGAQVELLPRPCHSARSSPATGVLSDPFVWGSQFSLCSLPPLFCYSSRKGTPCTASKASRTDVTPPSVNPGHVTH